MQHKAGITRRTFLFAAMLIVLVTLVSFAILYFAMPSYYLYKKEQALINGIERLEKELKEHTERSACAELIVDFAEKYNVTVTSLDPSGNPIVELTSPFISMVSVSIEEDPGHLMVNGEAADSEVLISVIDQLYLTMSQSKVNVDRESADSRSADGVDTDSGGSDSVRADEERPDYSGMEDSAAVEITKDRGAGDRTFSMDGMSTYILYDIGEDMFFERQIGSELIDHIQVQGTLQPIEEARGVILSLIPYVLAAGSVIGLVLAWFYARQITKPILALSATAERMMRMEDHVVSGLRTNDELGLLSENMDALYLSLSQTIGSLKSEMEKVNRLEQSKTEMMQSASHELKTPIAALGGMLDGMIDNIGVYKDKDKYLLKCKDQVGKLSFLVQEILDASKTDGGETAFEVTAVELDEMITHILKEYNVPVRDKQLQIAAALPPVAVETEPSLLYRALTNLIGNAVRYTPNGGTIHLLLSAERLEIENECVPIPEAELPKLFEPFYTRSDSRDKSESGTGLGLYIVKRNLERLSLKYQAENTGKGFKITVFLK